MPDRLEAMAILLRVVERGSFSAASRELRVPLATVSRRVSELEAHLGTRLLVRTTRRLAPTEAGAAYVTAARRILEAVDEAERVAAGEFQAPKGELILTAPLLFGRLHVLPEVAAFLAEYPDITVRLLLSDQTIRLAEEHVDMAVRIGPLPDSGMVATHIGSMRTVVCASPDLLARFGTPATPEVLVALPCVAFTAQSPAGAWQFRAPGGVVTEVPVRTRLAVSTADAAVWVATEGIGVARVLHYQCADAVHAGRLRIILGEFEVPPLPVHLLHAARGALPSKMRAFLDFATPRLRARLAGIEGK